MLGVARRLQILKYDAAGQRPAVVRVPAQGGTIPRVLRFAGGVFLDYGGIVEGPARKKLRTSESSKPS
jgi:hypothetical protein